MLLRRISEHPDLLFDLGFFYSERDGVGRKFVRYSEFVESEILPWLNGDPGVFYTADGALKPEYAANMIACGNGAATSKPSAAGPYASTPISRRPASRARRAGRVSSLTVQACRRVRQRAHPVYYR
ncbi:MAG: hypothetical protein WD795_02600 [Woeseia sp.]